MSLQIYELIFLLCLQFQWKGIHSWIAYWLELLIWYNHVSLLSVKEILFGNTTKDGIPQMEYVLEFWTWYYMRIKRGGSLSSVIYLLHKVNLNNGHNIGFLTAANRLWWWSLGIPWQSVWNGARLISLISVRSTHK